MELTINDINDSLKDPAAIEIALQIVPQIDRIIYKLHHYYGLRMEDIGYIVNRGSDEINNRITCVQDTLNEFMTC